MKDETKLKTSVIFLTVLCLLGIAYNISTEYLLPDIEGYIKRRLYYERVISKKGLSMHEALYWEKAK